MSTWDRRLVSRLWDEAGPSSGGYSLARTFGSGFLGELDSTSLAAASSFLHSSMSCSTFLGGERCGLWLHRLGLYIHRPGSRPTPPPGCEGSQQMSLQSLAGIGPECHGALCPSLMDPRSSLPSQYAWGQGAPQGPCWRRPVPAKADSEGCCHSLAMARPERHPTGRRAAASPPSSWGPFTL